MKWKKFHRELSLTIPAFKNIPEPFLKILILMFILLLIIPMFDSMLATVIKEEIPKTVACIVGIQWEYTAVFSLIEFCHNVFNLESENISEHTLLVESMYSVMVVFMHFTTTWVQLQIIKRNYNFLLALLAGTIIHFAYNNLLM